MLNPAGSLTISDCFARYFQNSGVLRTPYPTLPIFSRVSVSILNSLMNNNGNGLRVSGTGSQGTALTVRKSLANCNGIGFFVTGATLIFADTMATGNTQYGIFVGPIDGDVSHSTLLSYGDNEIDGNATNISEGTLVAVEKQ